MEEIEERFKKIETQLIEQEHRALPILKGVFDYGFDNSRPNERKAAWSSLFSFLLRRWTATVVISSFSFIGFFVTTYLLWNQNELIENQNVRIDQQTYLQEAERRSSLNFLMGNVFDKIDEELKEAERQGKPRRLSPQLIGRIASLSQSFQPYKFLDGDTMTNELLSPERGNLLIALVNSNLDTLTLDTIFQNATFEYAYLKGGSFESKYLKNVNLNKANLQTTFFYLANLEKAKFNKADLAGAVFSWANLKKADFNHSTLLSAQFQNANLTGANLYNALIDTVKTRFDGAILDSIVGKPEIGH